MGLSDAGTDQSISGVVVVLPECSDLALAANVPDVELEAARLEGLDVEALRWSDVCDLLLRQLFEDGRLAGVVQTQKQNPACY